MCLCYFNKCVKKETWIKFGFCVEDSKPAWVLWEEAASKDHPNSLLGTISIFSFFVVIFTSSKHKELTAFGRRVWISPVKPAFQSDQILSQVSDTLIKFVVTWCTLHIENCSENPYCSKQRCKGIVNFLSLSLSFQTYFPIPDFRFRMKEKAFWSNCRPRMIHASARQVCPTLVIYVQSCQMQKGIILWFLLSHLV